MFFVAVDRRRAAQIVTTLAAALLALSASRLPSRAAANHTVIIPPNDGYDFEDCLSADMACGKVIADAWCEAHGMSAAASFGRSDDITASVADRSGQHTAAAPIKAGSFVVTCAD